MTARILLADDDDDIRETLVDILSGEGYEVVAAASAPAALDALDRGAFHAVLTDAFGTEGDRLAGLAQIAGRARPPRVGALSGWEIPEETQRSLGVRFALQKPFDVVDMLV